MRTAPTHTLTHKITRDVFRTLTGCVALGQVYLTHTQDGQRPILVDIGPEVTESYFMSEYNALDNASQGLAARLDVWPAGQGWSAITTDRGSYVTT